MPPHSGSGLLCRRACRADEWKRRVEERQLTQTFRQNFIFELGPLVKVSRLGQKRTMVPVFSVRR